MHPIIYDVAVSLDGFISGPAEDVSSFAYEGPIVDDYNSRMLDYKTAIMGRATYEIGYRFGLEAGQNPYKHMKIYVFSKTLECPDNSEITLIRSTTELDLHHLKKLSDGPIYLCGGGEFAGSLLADRLIDRMFLKRTPIVLGDGVRLFGKTQSTTPLTRVNTKVYESGHILEEFRM